MPQLEIKESFEWMAPEFRVVDAGKNTIRIKGVAMKGDVISRNKRKYVDEELKKAARTWIGKPVTINHDGSKIIGDVKWMEYSDASDALEYLADIKKQPYVDMIRGKSTAIRGVSIEANYLHNRCPKCDRKFYTEEEFHSHMHNEHFIKTDPTTEPHGILGQALSLVLSPEEPGYGGSSIELLEMYEKPVLRLLETVAIDQQEKEDYMKAIKSKAALTSVKRIAAPIGRKLKEQEEPPTPPCPDGWHEVEGKCVKDEVATEQEEHECPEDEHWSEEEGKCVKNEASEQEEPITPGSHYCEEHPDDSRCIEHKKAIHGDQKVGEQEGTIDVPEGCPEGFHLEGTMCVADEEHIETPSIAQAMEQEESPVPPCPEGYHEEDGVCIKDIQPAEPLPVTVEFKALEVKLPKMLSLGEPFADYSSFEDCVSKNQDKGDPEAYCATIKRETEGETVKENIYDAQKALSETINNVRASQAKRNRIFADNLNKLNQATANIAKYVPAMNVPIQKSLGEISKNISSARSEAKKMFLELGRMRSDIKGLQEYSSKKFGQLATAQMNAAKAFKTQISHVNTESKKAVETVKKDFETVLAVADKNIEETRKTLEEQLKTITEEKQKLETQLKETQEKEVKETTNITTRLDNLEAKLTPVFKGKAVQIAETVTEHPEDPNKPLQKRRQ